MTLTQAHEEQTTCHSAERIFTSAGMHLGAAQESDCPTTWTVLPPAPLSRVSGIHLPPHLPAAPAGGTGLSAGRGDLPPNTPLQKLIYPDLSNVSDISFFLLCKVKGNKSGVENTSPE